MNFERNQDIKASLRVGRIERYRDIAERFTQENKFNLANLFIRTQVEKQFGEEIGFPVSIDIDIPRHLVYFIIEKRILCIKIPE